MPQSNMESSRSQWQQGLRSPWIIRVAESPASSGAESDTESSSTESERSCVKKLEVGSLRVLSSPSKLHQRITEIDQQKEELKIELQLEIALLQGELQTEKNQLLRHTQKLQALQQEARQGEKQRNDDRQTERQSLEEERQRVDELKKRCEEKEKALAAQPENERKQTNAAASAALAAASVLLCGSRVGAGMEKEVMEAAVRAFEDWEFRVLEQESGIDEEDDSAEDKVLDERKVELEKEICCQQHAMTAAQERVQQLETQLMDMEKEKESELNALRKEKRDLMHTTQTPSVTGTDPGTSSGVGLITPCNSTASSRAASPCLLDLMEIERKLREAKAERRETSEREGSFTQTWDVFLPETVKGLGGSCVIIPCRFSLPPEWDSYLDDSCKAIWKRGNWRRTQVFDSSLTGASASFNILQGNLTGNLQEKDCTTIFNNMPWDDDDYYWFRLECNNQLKFNFGRSFVMKIKALKWIPSVAHPEETVEANSVTSAVNFTTSPVHNGQKISCFALYSRQAGKSDLLFESSLTLRVLYLWLCSAAARQPAVTNYTWYKDDVEDEESGQILVIPGVDLSHSGSYYCEAKNDLGEERSTTIELDVQLPDGSTVTLTCASDANPGAHNFTWYRVTQTGEESDLSQADTVYANKLTIEEEEARKEEQIHYASVDFAKLQARAGDTPGGEEIRGLASKTEEYAEIRLRSTGSDGGEGAGNTTAHTELGEGKDIDGLVAGGEVPTEAQ
ncbi:unnamed protein product [Lampetra planeri]